MRLARVRDGDLVRPVVASDNGPWLDLRTIAPDVTPQLLESGLAEVRGALAGGSLPEVSLGSGWAPPLVGVGKIVCVGLNYALHAAESGAQPPSEPVLFMKNADTIVGPDDQVLIPRASVSTDYEVELAIVIGSTARYLDSPEQSLDHIAGYAISHDVSEREFQLHRGGQWDKGKNCETFNPMGPWILLPEPGALLVDRGLRLWVNSDLRQNGNMNDLIFAIPHLVWYISQFMVLYPGDVINTGTPAGVALGRVDKPYLRAGDIVELEIDGLGRQRQIMGQA